MNCWIIPFAGKFNTPIGIIKPYLAVIDSGRSGLAAEIVALQRTDEKLKKESDFCEECFQKLKQERGIPDWEDWGEER